MKRKATASAKSATKRVGKPSADDAAVQAYIAALPKGQREIAARFDALVARTVPKVRRILKWGMPFYGVPDRGWFVSCGGFPAAVKITFFQGESLRPLPPIGKGKQLRAIDVGSREAFAAAPIASWIKQAAALPGFGAGRQDG